MGSMFMSYVQNCLQIIMTKTSISMTKRASFTAVFIPFELVH